MSADKSKDDLSQSLGTSTDGEAFDNDEDFPLFMERIRNISERITKFKERTRKPHLNVTKDNVEMVLARMETLLDLVERPRIDTDKAKSPKPSEPGDELQKTDISFDNIEAALDGVIECVKQQVNGILERDQRLSELDERSEALMQFSKKANEESQNEARKQKRWRFW